MGPATLIIRMQSSRADNGSSSCAPYKLQNIFRNTPRPWVRLCCSICVTNERLWFTSPTPHPQDLSASDRKRNDPLWMSSPRPLTQNCWGSDGKQKEKNTIVNNVRCP